MSRIRVGEALTERWEETQEQFRSSFERFRESRLYVQTVCTMVLVVAGWLVHLLPFGPLARADAALQWVVSSDYDFPGQWRRAGGWASERGGWFPAVASLWNEGQGQFEEWVGALPTRATPEANTPPPVQSSAPPSQTPAAAESPAPTKELVSLPPVQPVEGDVYWGYGWLPQEVGEEFHEGMDFLAKAGTPVTAVQDGTVTAIRTDPQLGGVIEIRHGDLIAVYAQVQKSEVSAGDSVHRGQMIAVVAPSRGTEVALPAHLHFELRPVATGEPVDPASYLGLGGKRL